MTNPRVKPIGITDAEIRVYFQYLKEMDYVNDYICKIRHAIYLVEHAPENHADLIKLAPREKLQFYKDQIFYLERANTIDNLTYQLNKYIELKRVREGYCKRIRNVLCNLSKEDYQLIDYRYRKCMSLEKIAFVTHSNRQSIWEKLNKLLKFQVGNCDILVKY